MKETAGAKEMDPSKDKPDTPPTPLAKKIKLRKKVQPQSSSPA